MKRPSHTHPAVLPSLPPAACRLLRRGSPARLLAERTVLRHGLVSIRRALGCFGVV